MGDELKRTPLHDEHRRLDAKMVDFAGYAMPVQYPSGILAEHRTVRERVGLFDVSHMGELEVRGDDPQGFIQYVTTNDVSRIEPGRAQYTVFCQEDGGALDDGLVYRFEDRLMLVPNASNRERIRDWITQFAGRFGVEVRDRSDEIALLALQGPRAEAVLAPHADADLAQLGYYRFLETGVDGEPAIVSRTGYTGEDGFEVYLAADAAPSLWRALLETGQAEGIEPAGLGARDSLRLEMGYILYGNDLDADHTPLEAGLGWVVKLDKGDFLGRTALARQKEEGIRERLVGFELQERGFPRDGYEVRWRGEPAGEVTSGVVSPTLGKGIGLAYVPVEAAEPGTELEIVIRNRPVPAEVVRPPFYRDGSIRR
ncbi:MAG: glycine cleavage system aminomethyltransferase GcvT [Gemmatimonadota bacterium]